jgi:hypothetical protein
MPLSTCIENKTLVRICIFEMKRQAESITGADWREYLLASKALNMEHGGLRGSGGSHEDDKDGFVNKGRRVQSLKLLSAFQDKLEAKDMESMLADEPKLCIRMLVNALELTPFRQAIGKEMKMDTNKPQGKDLQKFADVVAGRMEAFLSYESSFPRQTADKQVKKREEKKGAGTPCGGYKGREGQKK